MQPYIDTRIHHSLFSAAEPTLRVWLFLTIMASRGQTMTFTAKGIAEAIRKYRLISRKAVSEALTQLEDLGLISIERVGRAMVIRMVRGDCQAAVA